MAFVISLLIQFMTQPVIYLQYVVQLVLLGIPVLGIFSMILGFRL